MGSILRPIRFSVLASALVLALASAGLAVGSTAEAGSRTFPLKDCLIERFAELQADRKAEHWSSGKWGSAEETGVRIAASAEGEAQASIANVLEVEPSAVVHAVGAGPSSRSANAVALEPCCREGRAQSAPPVAWRGSPLRDPYVTRFSGQTDIPESARLSFEPPENVGRTQVLPLTHFEPLSPKMTTREAVEAQVKAMGLDPDRNLTRAGSGGFSDAYFIHPDLPAELLEAWKQEGIRVGDRRLAWVREEAWIRENATEVIKIRRPKGTPHEMGKSLLRDTAMQEVAVELASKATYDGAPLIRVLRWNSSVAELERGIVRQEVVRGPTAKELEKAVFMVRAHSQRAYLSHSDRETLEASLKMLKEAGLTPDEAMDRIVALEGFYRRAHAPALGFAMDNRLSVYGNIAQNDQVQSVGLDYNHGGNVAWDAQRRIWVMFDW